MLAFRSRHGHNVGVRRREENGPRCQKQRRVFTLSLLLLSTLLLPGCSTGKSLKRVRALPADVGTRVELAGTLAELTEMLPALLKDLGYQDIASEPGAEGSFVLYGATGFTVASFGHGIRITVTPASDVKNVSRIDLALVRRLAANETEDLHAARARILTALVERFP